MAGQPDNVYCPPPPSLPPSNSRPKATLRLAPFLLASGRGGGREENPYFYPLPTPEFLSLFCKARLVGEMLPCHKRDP